MWDERFGEEEDAKQKRRDDYKKWYERGMK